MVNRKPGLAQRAVVLGLGVSLIAALWLSIGTVYRSENYALTPGDSTGDQLFSKLSSLQTKELRELQSGEIDRFQQAPLDYQRMSNIVALEELLQDKARVREARLRLAARSVRNFKGQLAALSIDVSESNYASAAFRLDAVLRAHPQLLDKLRPTLVALLSSATAAEAFAPLLKQNPAWRQNLFTFINPQIPPEQVYLALSNLRKLKLDVDGGDIRYLIKMLIENDQEEKAYFVWLDLLSTEEISKLGLLYDPGFEAAIHNQFYGWNIDQRPGARILRSGRPDNAQSKALKLEFFGSSGLFQNVYQYLRLAPGEYTVQFEVMSDKFESPGGLVWQVYCKNSLRPLGQSAVITPTKDWTPISFTISLPEVDCSTQVLRLKSASEAVLDNTFSGSLWLDNITISRVGG